MRCCRSLLIVVFLYAFLPIGVLLAQDNLRSQLFGETDALMQRAKEKSAELLAPRSYAKAKEYYDEAGRAFQQGSRIEDIREKLKNSGAYLAQALDVCAAGERRFNAAMIAREDARDAGAPKSVAELWNTAESRFHDAIHSLEGGDSAEATTAAPDVERLYRSAELEALKTNYLAPARALLKESDDLGAQDLVPKSLAKARSLVTEVEQLLQQNRRDADPVAGR